MFLWNFEEGSEGGKGGGDKVEFKDCLQIKNNEMSKLRPKTYASLLQACGVLNVNF